MTDQELVQAWIDALRSGKYQQTVNRLRKGNAFCVTGVLCDVIDNTRWVLDDDNDWRYDFGGTQWYGLYPNYLPLEDFVDNNGFMGNNDDGWTFEQLADKIELRWNMKQEQSNE